jgi:hypothetical protein
MAVEQAALGDEVAVFRLGRGSPSASALIYFAPRIVGEPSGRYITPRSS